MRCWFLVHTDRHTHTSVCYTCSKMELILFTSQSMRKRFSCRRSISSMMRRYSMGSTMFPTERAVTCQLLATADSMMAWRMEKPGGAEGGKLHHTTYRKQTGKTVLHATFNEKQRQKKTNSCLPLCSKNCKERKIIVDQCNTQKCFPPTPPRQQL